MCESSRQDAAQWARNYHKLEMKGLFIRNLQNLQLLFQSTTIENNINCQKIRQEIDVDVDVFSVRKMSFLKDIHTLIPKTQQSTCFQKSCIQKLILIENCSIVNQQKRHGHFPHIFIRRFNCSQSPPFTQKWHFFP